MTRGARWAAIALAALAALGYVGVSIAFHVKQGDWIHASPRDRRGGPTEHGLEGREERMAVPESGETFAAWWLPAEEAAPAVLYLVGVGHHLGSAAPALAALRAQGLSVLAIEYRGFGASDGRAREAGLYRDAEIAWQRLLALAPRAASHSLYGHSIGGAVALHLAGRVPTVAAVVTESTFTSMIDTMHQSRIMRMLPTRWLLAHRYPSLERVPALAVPKLFLHGDADEFVPPAMSRRLFEAAAPPRTLALVCGAGHSDALAASPQAQALVGRFLRSPGALASPPGCLPRKSA